MTGWAIVIATFALAAGWIEANAAVSIIVSAAALQAAWRLIFGRENSA